MALGKVRNMYRNLILNRIKVAEFAVTNACIAKCSFCDIWKQQPKVFVEREKALEAIDRIADLGTVHLTITGGEPLLHPHVVDFVRRATERKMHTAVLNAAPQLLLRDDIVQKLKDAGTDMICISLDSGDPVTMAQSRQIPNIMEDIASAVELVRKIKVKTMASILIWNDNYDKLDEVCIRAKKMGFDFISLNYPTFSQSTVYPLGGEGISLSRDKVIHGLQSAIKLRNSGKYGIINTAVSMKNIIKFLEDPKKVSYPCLGGKKVFFVDWFYNVHPCMQISRVLGSIFDIKAEGFKNPSCNQCNMSWYRDFSAMFQGLKSIPVWMQSLEGYRALK
ncbi:MAG: radical SAM protein [Treponema sp.]|nr:radical SAM protein [Treponema sp.]